MKKLLVIMSLLALSACNDQPLPAFVDNKQKCQEINCGEMQYTYTAPFHYSGNVYNPIDKHWDSISGHHDYSVESDH